MNYLKRFRDALLCVVLLGIPFFFLRANFKDPARASWLDRVILQISAPIQYVGIQAARGVSGLLEDYVYLVDVKREYERLRTENGWQRQELRKLRLEAAENLRLRRLLELRQRLHQHSRTAQVIGKEVSPFFRVIRVRIDRGERDGVRAGMPVLSADGLVGQIRRSSVWGRYADVLLTVDRSSAVDVVIKRSGARGILRGTGESDRYLCRIQYLQHTDEVRIGDEVYTSGLGRRFPAAILVGRVTRVHRKDFGVYQEAEVTPVVNLSTLEEVLILSGGVQAGNALDDSPDEDWL